MAGVQRKSTQCNVDVMSLPSAAPFDRSASETGAESRYGQEAGSRRVEALQQGVAAIVKAMGGEAQFANDNEVAFAQFRRGCRHCALLPADLDSIGPKDTIVAFLTRIASRRAVSRQVQELGAILVKAENWRALLGNAPPPLWEVLMDAGLLDVPSFGLEPEDVVGALDHCARVFLRERCSQRWLTVGLTVVADELNPTNDQTCAHQACSMTELPASLFICYRDCGRYKSGGTVCCVESGVASVESELAHAVHAPQVESLLASTWAFAHEGEPEFGHFLGGWRVRSLGNLRQAIKGGGDYGLSCTSRKLGEQEQFQWYEDAAIQHITSGLWLYVDPESPAKVTMHASERSSWEALPAI